MDTGNLITMQTPNNFLWLKKNVGRSQDGGVSRAVEITSPKHIDIWKYNKENSP